MSDVDMEWRLVEEFRRVPREYQADVVEQVRWIRRLVKRPVVRVVGEEGVQEVDQEVEHVHPVDVVESAGE